MASLYDTFARVGASADEFFKVMNQVESKARDVAGSVEQSNSKMSSGFEKLGSASKTFGNIGDKLGGVAKTTGKVGSKLTNSITKPAGIAATAAGGLVSALGFKRLAGMDSAKAKLKGLGYNADEVKNISGQVETAIEGSMTTMAEGTDVAAGALAAGVDEGKDLEQYIKLVGDAAVGANAPVDEMAQIFNKVQGGGKLMTQELNQIDQRLPGFSANMAEEMGKSQEEFREMVTNGEISSEQFLQSMDKFAGGMAKAQADSFTGLATNTKNYLGIIGEKLQSGIFDRAKKSLNDLVNFLSSDEVLEWADRFGKKIGDAFARIADGAESVIRWFMNLSSTSKKIIGAFSLVAVSAGPVLLAFSKVVGVMSSVSQGVSSVLGVMSKLGPVMSVLSGPVGWIIGALVALGTAFYVAYTKSETFRNFVNGIGEKIGAAIGWIKQFGSAIASLFGGEDSQQEGTNLLKKLGFSDEQIGKLQEMVGRIKSMFTTMGETLGTVFGRMGETWQQVVQAFQNAMPFFQLAFNNLLMIVGPIFQSIWNIVKTTFDTIVNVIMGAMQMVQGIIQIFGGLIQGDFGMMWNGIKNIFFGAVQILISLLKGLFMNLWHILTGIVKSIGGSLMAIFNTFKAPFIAIFTGIWNGIKAVTMYVWNGIKNAVITSVQTLRMRAIQIITALRTGLTAIWNGIKFVAVAVWNGIKYSILAVVRGIRATAVAIFNALRASITAIWNGIRAVSSAVWNGIKAVILAVIRGIRATALAIFRGLRAGIQAVWNGIKSAASATWNWIKNTIVRLATNLKNNALTMFRLLRSGIQAVWNGIKAAVSATWNWIRSTIVRLATALKNTALSVFRALRSGMQAIWNGIKSATSDAWNWIKSTAIRLATGLKNTVTNLFNALKSVISSIWNGIKSVTSNVWNGIKSIATRLATGLKTGVTKTFNALKSVVTGIWNGIKGTTSKVWNGIKGTATKLASNLRSSVTNTFKALKGAVTGIWNGIKGTTSKVWNGIKNTVTGFADTIKDKVTGSFNAMKDTLGNIIDGIKGFIGDMVSGIGDGLNKLIDGVNWVSDKIMGKKLLKHMELSGGTGGRLSDSSGALKQGTMATVGDKGKGNGKGRDGRRELIESPSGQLGLTPNRDTDVFLPPKFKVHSGAMTEKFINDFKPKFSEGTGGVGGGNPFKAGADWVGKKVGQGKDWAVDKGKKAAKAVGKGAGWLKDKVGDVMDYITKPEKLMDHVLDAFGVPSFGDVPGVFGDIMVGGYKKLKKAFLDKIKEWFAESESGDGDGKYIDISKGNINFPFDPDGSNPDYPFGGAHNGVDLNYIYDPLYSVINGTARGIKDNGNGFGNYMSIKDGALEVIYGHMSKLGWTGSKKVKPGDKLGISGNTGQSTGPHLHFEVRKNGKPIDPIKFVQGLGGKAGKAKPASQWKGDIRKAAKATNTKVSNADVNNIASLINAESSGNPGATQSGVDDVNSRSGNPAQGLLQYIPQTFKKYATKGHKNIKSGYDQLLAFFNNKNWKSQFNPNGGWSPTGPVRGYADSGIIDAPEMAWLAEGGFTESVISHDPKNRTRSKAIHDKTGQMLGVDTDTELLRRIAETLDIGNELQSVNNNISQGILNKSTDVYMDNDKLTDKVNNKQGDKMNMLNYQRGRR